MASGGCPRCGGGHTQRQRCPLDPAPPARVDPADGPRVVIIAQSLRGQRTARLGGITAGAPAAVPPAVPAHARGATGLPSPFPAAAATSSASGAVARVIGMIIGTMVLVICFIVATVYIAQLAEAGIDVGLTLTAIGAAVMIGVLFGMVPMWLSARGLAKALFAVLALALVTTGLGLLVAAPVVRQMNTTGLAEYRGFAALLWSGIVCIILGALLGGACVYWSMQRAARRTLARWSRLLGAAYGVFLGLAGLLAMFAMVSLINGEASIDETGVEWSVVEQSISLTAIAMWSFVPGLILAYHGISASMGEGSGEFRPPVTLYAALLFALVLAAGQYNMQRDVPVALPMPFLHVAAAALPGIALAAMAGRGSLTQGRPVRGVTWRQLTLAVAISMTVATSIALYVESIGSLYAVVLLLVHNGAFEFAQGSDGFWDQVYDSDIILTQNEQFIAGLIAAAVLAPIVEEFAKSLGVRFVMRANTTRAQAFLLGAYAGAGFGFLEALLYGLAGIQDDLGGWWAIMLLRGGSTSLHVICTGLGGLAWWYWSTARRHGLAFALISIAVLIHAGWNGAFTAIDSRILGLDTLEDRTIEIIAYSVVGVVSAMMIAAIPLVARRIRDVPAAPVAGTPLASMRPWVGE